MTEIIPSVTIAPFVYGAPQPNSPVAAPSGTDQGEPVALDPTVSNFPDSAVPLVGGHSICGAAHEIVPPAPLPTPGGGAGSPSAPSRASGGLGSSAYSSGLEGFDR
jgi:hypothetical protein